MGIEFAAPSRVTEIPATKLANSIASLKFLLFDKATLKAPLKASPAPVVSTTGTESFFEGIKNSSSLFLKNHPFSPRVIKIFFIPLSRNTLAADWQSFSLSID